MAQLTPLSPTCTFRVDPDFSLGSRVVVIPKLSWSVYFEYFWIVDLIDLQSCIRMATATVSRPNRSVRGYVIDECVPRVMKDKTCFIGKLLLINESEVTPVNITNVEMGKLLKRDTFVVMTEVEINVHGIRATDKTTVSVTVN